MDLEDERIDRIIDRLSAPFDGVVRAPRLLAAGVSEGAIKRRVISGKLITVFPGVYLVGHRGLSPQRVWWACVMEGGTGSALSRRSSAEARDLVGSVNPNEVTVAIPPNRDVRDLVAKVEYAGKPIQLHLHRSCGLVRQEVMPKFGHRLPMLSVPDTILDVAWHEEDEDFKELFRQAEFRRLTTDREIRAVLRRGRSGTAKVRQLLEKRTFGSMRFQNGFEEMGEALFEVFGLGVPLVNVRVKVAGGTVRVDLYWPGLALVIELDGGGHGTVGGKALDAENTAKLRAAGIDVMRFDWDQVMHRPDEIRAALVGAGYLPAAA